MFGSALQKQFSFPQTIPAKATIPKYFELSINSTLNCIAF